MAAIAQATGWRIADGRLIDTRSLGTRLTDTSLIGYAEFAAMTDRKPQSLRQAMMRRKEHIQDEGRARATDILEPVGYRYSWPRTEPFWRYGEVLEWALRTGKLARDGVTPIHYRGSLKKRKPAAPVQDEVAADAA